MHLTDPEIVRLILYTILGLMEVQIGWLTLRDWHTGKKDERGLTIGSAVIATILLCGIGLIIASLRA